jgi:hypothetical protein
MTPRATPRPRRHHAVLAFGGESLHWMRPWGDEASGAVVAAKTP